MPKRVTLVVVLTLLLSAALAACDRHGSPASTATPVSAPATPTTAAEATPTVAPLDLAGTRWTLATLDGVALGDSAAISLGFTAGQAGGFVGCDIYGGAYTLSDGGGFALPDVLHAERDCDGRTDVGALADTYVDALRRAASARLAGERLELADAAGDTTLVFARDDGSALAGTSWLLVNLDERLLVDNTHITIAFSDAQVSGSAGCNQFSGSYSVGADDALALADVSATEMACPRPEGVMPQERAFLDALAATAAFHFDVANNRLKLLGPYGERRLVFANQHESLGTGLLDGTGWALTTLNGRPTLNETTITLMLYSSQFVGRLPCFGYLGFIQTAPDGRLLSLRLDPPRSCPAAPAPGFAQRFYDALTAATQYRVSSDRLEFLDANGASLLAFTPGLPDGGGLDGTRWRLLSLAGAEVLAGSAITLEFSDNGYGGDSGCNAYGGAYMVVAPGLLSIGVLSSTAMSCADPPGVLEQEEAYQAALMDAVGYRLDNDQLYLLNLAGDPVLVFERDR